MRAQPVNAKLWAVKFGLYGPPAVALRHPVQHARIGGTGHWQVGQGQGRASAQTPDHRAPGAVRNFGVRDRLKTVQPRHAVAHRPLGLVSFWSSGSGFWRFSLREGASIRLRHAQPSGQPVQHLDIIGIFIGKGRTRSARWFAASAEYGFWNFLNAGHMRFGTLPGGFKTRTLRRALGFHIAQLSIAAGVACAIFSDT